MSITPFNFNGAEVRAVNQGADPWFVLVDVCSVLDIANARDAAASLDDDEKNTVAINDGTPGNPNTTIINESGLYSLTLRSRKPEAKAFKKWVTSEVLPAIRKTGSFISHPVALRLLADKIEENEALQLVVKEQAPAVEFVNRYVRAEGLFGIRETAKILGLKQNVFTAMCQDNKILFREGKALQPYAVHMDKGYFEVKTGEANEHAYKQTRFTAKGIEWVRRYLRIDALLAPTHRKEAA